MVRKTRSVVVLQSRMRDDKRLDDNIFNISPYLFFVVTIFIKPFIEMGYFPAKFEYANSETIVYSILQVPIFKLLSRKHSIIYCFY